MNISLMTSRLQLRREKLTKDTIMNPDPRDIHLNVRITQYELDLILEDHRQCVLSQQCRSDCAANIQCLCVCKSGACRAAIA